MEPCGECGELIVEETLPDLIPRPGIAGQLGLPLIQYAPLWVHAWTGHQRCEGGRGTVASPAAAQQATR